MENIFKKAFLANEFIRKDGAVLLYASTKNDKAILAKGEDSKGKAQLCTYNLDGTSADGDEEKRIIGKVIMTRNFEYKIVYFEEKN